MSNNNGMVYVWDISDIVNYKQSNSDTLESKLLGVIELPVKVKY